MLWLVPLLGSSFRAYNAYSALATLWLLEKFLYSSPFKLVKSITLIGYFSYILFAREVALTHLLLSLRRVISSLSLSVGVHVCWMRVSENMCIQNYSFRFVLNVILCWQRAICTHAAYSFSPLFHIFMYVYAGRPVPSHTLTHYRLCATHATRLP